VSNCTLVRALAFAAQAQEEGKPKERYTMRAERFLEPGPPPIDADEVREALWEALMEKAPPALVRLVGRSAYQRCARGPCAPRGSAGFASVFAKVLPMLVRLVPGAPFIAWVDG
jgi:hypothetical protein